MRYLTLLVLCLGCGKQAPKPVDAAEPGGEVISGVVDETDTPTTDERRPVPEMPQPRDIDAPSPPPVAAVDPPDVGPSDGLAEPSDAGPDIAETQLKGIIGDLAEALNAPAELPATPSLAPEVRARLETGAVGCVGLGKNGRVLLSIVQAEGTEKLLRLADFSAEDAGFNEGSWPLGADTKRGLIAAFEDGALTGALEGKKLVPCTEVMGKPPLTIPLPVPVALTATETRATLTIEGNRPVPVDLWDEGGAPWVVQAAYWSTETGAMFVRLHQPGAESAKAAHRGFALEAVFAPDLGMSACVPRPLNGKPISLTVPPFEAAPKEVQCVAMSADGSKAAFKTWYKSRGDRRESAPNKIEWYGPGATPQVDLGCMARKCKPEELAKITEQAAAAGLVGCAIARGAVAVDGMLAPFVYSKNLLRFQGGSSWRTVYELERDEAKGRESLWKAFQLPTGGPIYLYVGYDEGEVMGEGVRVIVLDEGALNLCPPPREGTLAVTSVNVSGAEKDGSGYKFGGSQAVDGDLTTGWQPGKLEKGASAWIELVLDGERELEAVEIANGFQRKDGNGDLFALNARAAEVVIGFDDGTSEKVTLDGETRGLRLVSFAPRKSAKVRLTLAGMHAGTRWVNDLALSEVRVIGK